MKSRNVILFPKWQKVLEEESIAAIKEKKFEEALEKLNNLLSYQVKNHEIYTGKLICLMELERFDEAQELCESLIEEKDEHFYQYIHIYLTLLFQTNQYDALIEKVDELTASKIPQELREPFKQLYQMSEKMRLNVEHEQSNLYIEALKDAVSQDNHIEQWRLVQNLGKMNVDPNEKIITFLVDNRIHPLVKSSIFLWLKHREYQQSVEIHKFGVHLEKVPIETEDLKENRLVELVSLKIREVEQNNPSLAHVMTTLLEHYLFVLYPIIPPIEDSPFIGEALVKIGNEYLHGNDPSRDNGDKRISKYIQEIKTTDLLYASIAED